jgi:hypothetical protein
MNNKIHCPSLVGSIKGHGTINHSMEDGHVKLYDGYFKRIKTTYPLVTYPECLGLCSCIFWRDRGSEGS